MVKRENQELDSEVLLVRLVPQDLRVSQGPQDLQELRASRAFEATLALLGHRGTEGLQACPGHQDRRVSVGREAGMDLLDLQDRRDPQERRGFLGHPDPKATREKLGLELLVQEALVDCLALRVARALWESVAPLA